jgi:hypothetical protein
MHKINMKIIIKVMPILITIQLIIIIIKIVKLVLMVITTKEIMAKSYSISENKKIWLIN